MVLALAGGRVPADAVGTAGAATLLGVARVMLRSFEQLADIFVITILPFYALAVVAVFPLR